MITAGIFAKTRAEIIELFDWNADSLTPDQTLRIDCAVALRLALDDLQGRVVRGESIDIARMLTASEALSRLLPPAVLSQPPAEQREDHEAAIAPLLKLYRYLHESVHTLSAENAQLKARLGEGGAFPSVPLDVPTERVAISPTEADVTPPGEWRGETYAGPVRPGPDDRPQPPVIEARAVPKKSGHDQTKPPNPPAARPPQSWDETDNGKAWRAWVDAGGGVGRDPWANNQ